MPRFEKGSQEAKDYMAKIRNARKAEGYVPPANKRLTKKQKEAMEMKSTTVDIPIMGETTLVVPEYFAVPRKGGYKLVNPMSQERNLSSRRGKKSLKIVRKPVGDIVLVREDGAEEPLPLLAFSKKDRELIKGHFKLVEKYKDTDPIDVPRIGRPKPAERGRPEKLPKNVAVHKQRKTRPGWSAKKSKKAEDEDEENVSMTIEEEGEETPAPAPYQRKKRQTYATEEERKEAIKQQKRDYARRKRASAKGKGIVEDIKSGFKKTTEYLGAVVKGRGNMYPPKVRNLLGRWGDKRIVSAELRRSPVQSLLTKAMNALTFGQFSKNMEKTPYDKLFHLQVVLTLDHPSSPKLLLEKNEVINMDLLKSKGLKKGTEVLPVSPIQGVVLNDALEKTKTKMGATRFFDYNAVSNNCQDFILSLFKANGWGDQNDYDFIKQDTKQLFTGLSGLAKTAYTLTELGERANVAMTGRGGGSSKQKVMSYKPPERDLYLDKLLADNERLRMINAELLARTRARIAETGDPMAIVRKVGKKMTDRISADDFVAIDRRGREIEDQYAPILRSKALTQKAIADADKQSAMNAVMEGEGLLDWIRQQLKSKKQVQPYKDYGERLDKMITQARAEQSKAIKEGYRKDKGLPPLKPKPTASVAPAYVMPPPAPPVYNDMVFDDEGELIEGEGMGSNYVVQSVIFKKSKYSVAEAKKWLKENKYKSPKVDETENMLRFRQMSPKMVDKKGYTEYRNKPLGKSGIELILAYKGRIQGGSGRPKPDMSGFPDDDEEEEEQTTNIDAPYLPDDLVAEVISFLPNALQTAYGISNRTIQRNTFSRAGLLTELQRLETMLHREAKDPRKKARLRRLINKLRERLQMPPLSPTTNILKRPPPREDDDEDGVGPPLIPRQLDIPASGMGFKMRLQTRVKNY